MEYTREFERNLFSGRPAECFEYMKTNYGDQKEWGDPFAILLKVREEYLKTLDSLIIEGAPEFLEFISGLGVPVVCYGGLAEEKIVPEMKEYMHYFERYISINDIRPGMKEITKDIYGLEFNQNLFIDDVNKVAEVCKANNIPFIGIPADFPWSFQKQEMIDTKVKYILNSVKDIDRALIEKIDNEASVGRIWE
jgi:hypothetical protein